MHRHSNVLAGSFALTPQEVARRLAHAHSGLLALHQGQVVAMAWLAFNVQAVVEIDRTLRLRPGESLSYDEFTLPAWRGMGINPRLNQFADGCAREHGAGRRITWRRLCNAPAVRVAEKLGHRQFCVATTVRVLGIDHAWVLGLHAPELRRLVRP
jgi:GNAT superfamily N-acetyltransferase